MIYSGGSFSYQDLMTMPLPAITLLVKRINEKTERQQQAMSNKNR
jgi:hypothetical protein